MKPHVEVAEGRFLPSRYRYALCRLVAFFILKSAVRTPRSSVPDRRHVVILDRDQNPFESFALSIFFDVWIALCVTGIATSYGRITRLPAVGLFAILLLAAPAAIQILLYAFSGVRGVLRGVGLGIAEVNYEAQATAFFVVMTAAAALAVFSRRSGLGLLGWIWFAVVGLNAAAALIMRLLAGAVAMAESQLRERPSEF